MIRLGIVGCNYGRHVQLPAFRLDLRCHIAAIAGANKARTEQVARDCNIAKGYGEWRELVEDPEIDAVAIATLPTLQSQIAVRSLELGKPVFVEKPLAADLTAAKIMLKQATLSQLPTMIDFNFPEISAWQRTKTMLDDGAIGALRHVVVNWQVESRAIQMRMRNWKTLATDGGGVLGNFISHCFHYLERFCGPIAGVSARLSGLPGNADDAVETTAVLAIAFQAGATGSLSMSCASYRGGGHRIEFYGEEGTLVLENTKTDYMRGFELFYAKRPAEALEAITVPDPLGGQYPDGRIAPVSRLAKRFFDSIENGSPASPGFAEGYRVQQLIDAARRSHNNGRWIDIAADSPEKIE